MRESVRMLTHTHECAYVCTEHRYSLLQSKYMRNASLHAMMHTSIRIFRTIFFFLYIDLCILQIIRVIQIPAQPFRLCLNLYAHNCVCEVNCMHVSVIYIAPHSRDVNAVMGTSEKYQRICVGKYVQCHLWLMNRPQSVFYSFWVCVPTCCHTRQWNRLREIFLLKT